MDNTNLITAPCMYCGDRYVLLDDRLDDPDNYPGIEHAAHALSQINRFGGHTLRPYSVAEHSLAVASIAHARYARELSSRDLTELALACLTHDVHEAFIGDMPTPLKRVLGPAWASLEARCEDAVQRRYGVREYIEKWAAQVKECDLIALATEKDRVLPRELVTDEWDILVGVRPATHVDLSVDIHTPQQWAAEFVTLYRHFTALLTAREPSL